MSPEHSGGMQGEDTELLETPADFADDQEKELVDTLLRSRRFIHKVRSEFLSPELLVEPFSADPLIGQYIADAAATEEELGDLVRIARQLTLLSCITVQVPSLDPRKRISLAVGTIASRRSEYLIRQWVFKRLHKILDNPGLAAVSRTNPHSDDEQGQVPKATPYVQTPSTKKGQGIDPFSELEQEFALQVASLWAERDIVEPPVDPSGIVFGEVLPEIEGGSTVRVEELKLTEIESTDQTRLIATLEKRPQGLEVGETVALPWCVVSDLVQTNRMALR